MWFQAELLAISPGYLACHSFWINHKNRKLDFQVSPRDFTSYHLQSPRKYMYIFFTCTYTSPNLYRNDSLINTPTKQHINVLNFLNASSSACWDFCDEDNFSRLLASGCDASAARLSNKLLVSWLLLCDAEKLWFELFSGAGFDTVVRQLVDGSEISASWEDLSKLFMSPSTSSAIISIHLSHVLPGPYYTTLSVS